MVEKPQQLELPLHLPEPPLSSVRMNVRVGVLRLPATRFDIDRIVGSRPRGEAAQDAFDSERGCSWDDEY